MEFTIFAAGKPPHRCVLRARGGTPPPAVCRPDEPCPAALWAGECRVIAATRPVFEAFSQIVSFEVVRVVRRIGRRWEVFEETGARAALRLLFVALKHSACPFFRRFSLVCEKEPYGDGYAAFARLARSLVRGEDAPPLPDADASGALRDKADGICRELEEHLLPLLAEARRRCRKDAVVNAVVLMCSSGRLACDHLHETGAAEPAWRPSQASMAAGR